MTTTTAPRPSTEPSSNPSSNPSTEPNTGERLNRLRAAVLGANDGIVSTAAVLVGVAGATSDSRTIAMPGMAAVVGGAVSMALGEYVSVSSQRDSERVMGETELVNPYSAAIASFISFVLGAALPFAAAVLAPVWTIFAVTLVALVLTGTLSAKLVSAPLAPAIGRIVGGGMLALAVTFAAGWIFGAAV